MQRTNPPKLTEGVHYYIENGLYVFTAHFLKARGYCCNNGCRHCPYRDGQPSKSEYSEGDYPVSETK